GRPQAQVGVEYVEVPGLVGLVLEIRHRAQRGRDLPVRGERRAAEAHATIAAAVARLAQAAVVPGGFMRGRDRAQIEEAVQLEILRARIAAETEKHGEGER